MGDQESFSLDSEDVREQLEQQRVLASQLREKLEHDEQQLARKEQKNELLKSKLTLLKSRSKAKQSAGSSEKDERYAKLSIDNSDGSQKTLDTNYTERKQAHNTSSKGKINILREQLEQNRLRFERHGKEISEDARSMEAMVEQLRHQLEERDVTIQQLQAGQDSSVALTFEEQIPESVDVATQLLQKEDQVKNLMAQVSDQQNIILELQENLKEKDCVIEARTQAISLLSEDMSKKWRANVDMLEETRQQMKMMQENFVRIEAGLNSEIEHLNLQLSNTSKKLSHAEQNVKSADTAYNDLVNKNSELLKEIKRLQELTQGGSGHKEVTSKIEELTQALSEANRLTVKLKAEHKAKVKTLNKQIDSLRKDSDTSAELVQLQNHIAELEEEKGNLQLHLIEVEESTVMQEQKISELQTIISEFRNKKICAKNEVSEMDDQLQTQGINQEMTELRCKLEDKENEIKHLKQLVDTADLSLKDESVSDLKNELEDVRSALKEWQCRYNEIEKQLQERNDHECQQMSSTYSYSDVEELRSKVALYENSLLRKVELLEQASHEKQLEVQGLETMVQNCVDRIKSFSFTEGDEKNCFNCQLMNKTLVQRDLSLSDQHAQITEMKISLDKLKEQNENLVIKLSEISEEALHSKECCEEHLSRNQPQELSTGETISDLQRELIEATGELELKREECIKLENKLRAQAEKTKKIAVNLKVKTVANKELEERVSKYESLLQNSKVEIDQLTREKQNILEKWQTEMSEKDAALSQVAENLASRESDVEDLSQQLRSKSSSFLELQEKFTSLQRYMEELKITIEEKSVVIDKLTHSSMEQDSKAENERITELQTEIVSLQSQLSSVIEEKQAAILKLETFTKQAKLKLAKEKKVRSDMLEKQSELEALIAEKTCVLLKHEKEIECLQKENGRLQTIVAEHIDLAASLRQELECEKNKLQFANENVMTEVEHIEEALDLHLLPSLESFQNEVEDFCLSISGNSPQDVLLILEEEKVKTMNELSCSFESLHKQIVTSLQSRPDLHADRKLFTELKNLVTRVINRTTALERKIKKIISESETQIQMKLVGAEKNIEVLERTLFEARDHLDQKEIERLNLEDAVNNLNKERWDLTQQAQQESQKSLDLEVKLKDTRDQLDALIQSANNLQQEVNGKDIVIQDLQSKVRDASAQNERAQVQLQKLEQQNCDLQIKLEKQDELHQSYQVLMEENEAWKLKHISTEEELNNYRLSAKELENQLNEAMKRCESLQNEVYRATKEAGEMQQQIQSTNQSAQELKQRLEETLHSSTLIQHELSSKTDSYLQQSALWAHEKEQFESRISDLMNQLQSVHIASTEQTPLMVTSAVNSEEVEVLRQHLQEKSAEVENYQRRLIQLQMGGSDCNVSSFEFSNNKQQHSEVILSNEKVTNVEDAVQSQGNALRSHLILDAFQPAASFFETSSEMGELHEKIRELSQQLEVLSSEKKVLETEKVGLQTNLDNVYTLLNAAKSDLEAANSNISILDDLKLKVAELTAALDISQSCVEQEKLNAQKLRDDLKQIEWKLENEKFHKERAENELKAQRETERPSIPQSLDTHVSSLQSSGSGFDSEENPGKPVTKRTDESLMESNITQLESELRGMVTSLRESAVKQKTMEDCWNEDSEAVDSGPKNDKIKKKVELDDKKALEHADSHTDEISNLKDKLAQLQAEKNVALVQIEALQLQMQISSQPSLEASSTSQAVISASDPLMTEDDSWEWGSESAHLEVQHQVQKFQNQPCSNDIISDLEGKIDSLKSDNESLEKEKLQLSEDLKASQIRAAKLTRKLRDLKVKYDEMSDKNRSTDSPFDSLDQAIEEERIKQMQGLEKELKDVQTELNTVKADRDKLQKQVDVFSSATERMMEAKERQDLEVEMWQKRSKDLSHQVQSLEWKIRELEEGKHESPYQEGGSGDDNQISEKTSQSPETLNPVEIEQLLKENHTWNSNYENLMQEYQKLRAQCLADSEQRTQVDTILAQQKGMIERLEHEKTYFQDVYDSLKMDYEAACAQLASKQIDEDERMQFTRKTAELEEKLCLVEKQLSETLAQNQVVSSENAKLQAQCSQLDETRESLLSQLGESLNRLEVNAQEINGLHERVRTLEEGSINQTTFVDSTSKLNQEITCELSQDNDCILQTPVNEVFVAHQTTPQDSSPSSTVLNWSSVVPGGDHSSLDVFEKIASYSAQDLEEQLRIKEQEMQKDKRMIETLKRSHQEAEQEWSQIIEYHKSQLEAAKKSINDLQFQVESHELNTINNDETLQLKLDFNNQKQISEQFQNVIFDKEKEMESLQISLAVSEESKKQLEEELRTKEGELSRLLNQNPQSQTLFTTEIPSSNYDIGNSVQSSPLLNASVLSSLDKNLSNELDLALNMLYERDVRCEELTQELTRLLEERDSLQLRLSNAIRTNEELRERLKHLLPSQSDDLSFKLGQDQKVGVLPLENMNVISSSTYEQVSAPEDNHLSLENKLAELRKIGYSHDKWLREDSEYRHQQQMRLLSPSPSNLSVVSGSPIELNTTVELTSSTASETTEGSSNADSTGVEQSSSNDSQGSLLSWFWGST